ncbi:MAG: ketoacyl-ACP synthase III [Pseudomonadota bacterium]|jgi:3-oxoacyl-[acyl-carrier-protein] synthase-3|nr:MAG: 3-oxoacyl-ACP synthase [Pseudomonadota bacterium]
MTHAVVTGWGKCLPPAILSNADLATFLDTSDEWIRTRTGIAERRIAHTGLGQLAEVAARRALAAAGMEPAQLELIVFGTTSFDDQAPNQASGLQQCLGAKGAAAMDVNTACTSFLYAWSTANALIRTGAVRNALVVGGEVISRFMDWGNRNVAVLFGDGCAALVLEATDREEGLLGEKLGCDVDGRDALVIRGMGGRYADFTRRMGVTEWVFEGQEIFRRAVAGMVRASAAVLDARGRGPADVDLMVPHQANLRIIEAVAQKLGIPPERAFVNVQRYGNMSAATVPVALVEALEEGRVPPGGLLLLPAFGAGLTWCAHLVRWGERVRPLGESDASLPPCGASGLDLVRELIRLRAGAGG